ncbi:putative ribonuclease H-like domain-containing protein [Tanacetum coccineum]
MISMRLKKFYKKTRRNLQSDAKEPVGFDKTKVKCFNCHNTWHFARECRSKGNQESRRRDAGNTGYKAQDIGRRPGKLEEPKDLVTLDGDGSDTEVTSCSKECEESYAKLKKLYDEQREKLGNASIEIQAYTHALKKISVKDKSGLGYGDQTHEGVLSYENEVLESVFDNRSSDVEDTYVYDRFAKVEGMHDESKFTYGSKQSKTSESNAKTNDFTSCESNSSVETLKSVPKPTVNEPKAVSKPKVWFDAPIIKEYDFGHLIRDCDFHEKRMAKQVELNKQKGKGTCQGENRPVFNAVKQNLSIQAAATNTTRKVNTARPIVNEIRPRNNFYKSHSSIRRPFNRTTAPKANFTNHKVNTARDKTVSAVRGNRETVVKAKASCNWRSKIHYWNKVSKYNSGSNSSKNDDPQKDLKNKGIVDSGCSRHMTGNKAYLVEYQDYYGGPVAFGGSKRYITGKGKIKIGKLDFEDLCFVKELQHFNLFSVSQMCDKKNNVLFTDTECLVLSPDFRLPDKNQVLLRVPRQNNTYSLNLENIIPSRGLACLIAKATVDESNKWYRRLGHVNFKNLNKLMKGNLVRGLPSKIFQNDHTCVACQKGKQHKASCKAKSVSSISQPL